MKAFFKQIFIHSTGLMLLEMLLVMPLYMLIFGGIFYIGDCILRDNRVLQGGCALGYVALHASENDRVDDSFTEAMERFQDKDGWLRQLPNDQGKLEWTAYFMNSEDDSLVTNTVWGGILYSYAMLKNYPLPLGIDGMLRMWDGLYDPSRVGQPLPTMNFGLRQEKDTSLRHWLVARRENMPASRPPMIDIISDTETVEEKKDSKCVYYKGARKYINYAAEVLVEDWILQKEPNGVSASSGDDSLFYLRIYGTFFSGKNQKAGQ